MYIVIIIFVLVLPFQVFVFFIAVVDILLQGSRLGGIGPLSTGTRVDGAAA